MKTSHTKRPQERIAAEWDVPIDQIQAFAKIIAERGGLTGNEYEDLNLAAIAYSKACSLHECVGWLPFDVMPNWKDDVFCILQDEDRWRVALDSNQDIVALARIMRTELLNY